MVYGKTLLPAVLSSKSKNQGRITKCEANDLWIVIAHTNEAECLHQRREPLSKDIGLVLSVLLR